MYSDLFCYGLGFEVEFLIFVVVFRTQYGKLQHK